MQRAQHHVAAAPMPVVAALLGDGRRQRGLAVWRITHLDKTQAFRAQPLRRAARVVRHHIQKALARKALRFALHCVHQYFRRFMHIAIRHMECAATNARIAQVTVGLAFFEDGDFYALLCKAQTAGEAGESAADDEGFVGGCGVHVGFL